MVSLVDLVPSKGARSTVAAGGGTALDGVPLRQANSIRHRTVTIAPESQNCDDEASIFECFVSNDSVCLLNGNPNEH
jgi:hypothetical protein